MVINEPLVVGTSRLVWVWAIKQHIMVLMCAVNVVVRLICEMCALLRLSVFEEGKFIVLWPLNIHILFSPVRDD